MRLSLEGGFYFRPKSLGIYRPTTHDITVTFLRFFENPKKRDFTFFALLHTFS